MKKNWIRLILLLPLIILFSGCSYFYKTSFPIEKIISSSDGIYVYKTEDQTCYSLSFPEIDSINNNIFKRNISGYKSVFLYSPTDLANIPIINSNDYLILKSEKEVNEVIPFIPLIDYGYSLGILIEKEEKDNYKIASLTNSIASNSNASKLLGDIRSLKNFRILKIGDEVINDEILSDVGTVNGLKENFTYEIFLLKGTIEEKRELIADTKVLVTDTNLIRKVEKIQYTEGGFAILDLGDIPTGYYYINSIQGYFKTGGIFYYLNES